MCACRSIGAAMLAEKMNTTSYSEDDTSAQDRLEKTQATAALCDAHHDEDTLHNGTNGKENLSPEVKDVIVLPDDTFQDVLPGRPSLSTDSNTAECSISSGESFKDNCSQRSILRADSRIAEPKDRPSHERKRRISFGTVLVRDYSIILGDHPCVSYGPPLTIDWDYHEHEPRDVDEYEFDAALSRRTLRGMLLNYYQRKYLLADYTKQDFKAVKKEINRIKSRRDITKKLARYQTIDAAIESACRKIKRMMK